MLQGALMNIVGLEILGDNKVVFNWMNGAWEVKEKRQTVPGARRG